MSIKEDDLIFFNKGKIENPKFWSRLGGEPLFEGKKILDVGCGFGSLCIDMVSKKAKKVVGLDIHEYPLKFAGENLEKNFPELAKKLEFQLGEVFDLPRNEFDIIVSKDAFEHILELDKVLYKMIKLLKPEGKIYIGCSQLYNSHFGDHGSLIKNVIPWAHLMFPESFLLKRLNKRNNSKISSAKELGLNQMSLAEIRNLLFNCGLKVSLYKINASKNLVLRLFSLLRRIPFLKEFFSYNLYCILEKDSK
ncbi:MAG: class I SAM-dependent methyltransferase [Armatimonadetes bacterium]|nr:class I SAM-dependent methyltransferase [Armatimonadota bacterium]